MASPFKSSFLTHAVFFYFHCCIVLHWPTNPFKTIVLTPSIQGCAHRLELKDNFPDALAVFYKITSLPDLRLSENSEPQLHTYTYNIICNYAF